jgi:hypothetical protein
MIDASVGVTSVKIKWIPANLGVNHIKIMGMLGLTDGIHIFSISSMLGCVIKIVVIIFLVCLFVKGPQ